MVNANEEIQNQSLGGIYCSTALGYYLFGRRKDIKKCKLFLEGKKKSLEIKQIKEEAIEGSKK